MKHLVSPAFSLLAAALALGGCASMAGSGPAGNASPRSVDNLSLPEAVRVPAGARLLLATTGVGEITYECREKTGSAGTFEWAFVAPVATLYGDGRRVEGRYYAGPTWESNDGSKVTGKQVAVAPAAAGSIPLQLVKADPPMGAGALSGVAYIQRVNTRGGTAPAAACDADQRNQRRQVAYTADYLFYGW